MRIAAFAGLIAVGIVGCTGAQVARPVTPAPPLLELRAAHLDSAPGRIRVFVDGRHFFLDTIPLITDADIRDARAFVRGSQLTLDVNLTPAGSERLVRFSGANLGKHLAVLLDARVRNAAVIQGAIGATGNMQLGVELPDGEADRVAETVRRRWPAP